EHLRRPRRAQLGDHLQPVGGPMTAYEPRRVVVTGVGLVTPVGNDREGTWRALLAGENGIGPCTLVATDDLPSQIAGEVKDFEVSRWLDRKEARRMDRFTHLAIAAAGEALEQS